MKIDDYRKCVGMVFQHFNLFPNMSVIRNIALAPIRGLGLSKEESNKKAMELLERVGLAHKAEAFPNKLSGGQKQRIAIARALALKPEVIIFDEATSNLDPLTERRICNNLKQLHITQIVVTHRLNAIQDADTIYVVEKGKIIESGTHVELLQLKGAYYDSVNN
jgi:ABC-type polar amino acid transport system ATPase subunit